jgi:hypothetical protein
MLNDWRAFERFGWLMQSHSWIFAATMADNPHCYTLRKHWGKDMDFDWAVQYIRDNGYKHEYCGRAYTQLDLNSHFYWTMGAPISETILINRKVRALPSEYDTIAPRYDGLFCGKDDQTESKRAYTLLACAPDESVLDVGCGTGAFLEYNDPKDYTGIDLSNGMVDHFRKRWPERHVICAPLGSFVGKTCWLARRFDVVVAMFGSASYLSVQELERIPGMLTPVTGRFFLMFYADNYVPVTYQKTGVFCRHSKYQGIPEGAVSLLGNFIVVEGNNNAGSNLSETDGV